MNSDTIENGQPVQEDHSSIAEDEFEIDPSLAASMGFSSFGNHTKKRKHNGDNAVTDATPLPGKIKRPQGVLSGRGANITPLGIRKGPSAPGQEDGAHEFDLPHGAPPPIVDRGQVQAVTTTSGQDQKPGTPELGAYRQGVRQPNGDIAYFLTSFIEDPWAHFKKK